MCGPEPDVVQIKLNEALMNLAKQGVKAERFNLARQLKDFMANPEVSKLLRTNGKKVLPITVVNGKIIKTGAYPSYEELCLALGLKPVKVSVMVLKQEF